MTEIFGDTIVPYHYVVYGMIENGSKVLDIGCGAGKFGEILRLKKNCYLVGIEIDEKSANIAKDRLNKVIIADVEKFPIEELPKNFFDVILFLTVLEHLKDPLNVLTLSKEYLNDHGMILVVVPNVANWTIRLKLLLGRWDYKPAGLLAWGHLRFFTLYSIKGLIEQAGYKIVSVVSHSGWSWLDRKFLLRNPANLWKSLLSAIFIIKAIKVH
ncbi:MAG: class I SAM-dependent methyltransferase [Candidatus Bathyarchaeia archaeon]